MIRIQWLSNLLVMVVHGIDYWLAVGQRWTSVFWLRQVFIKNQKSMLFQTANQHNEHLLQASHTVPVSKSYSPDVLLILYLVTVPDSLHPFQLWLLGFVIGLTPWATLMWVQPISCTREKHQTTQERRYVSEVTHFRTVRHKCYKCALQYKSGAVTHLPIWCHHIDYFQHVWAHLILSDTV